MADYTICRVKTTKKMLAMRVGGDSDVDLFRVKEAGYNLGYADIDLETLFVTAAEYAVMVQEDTDLQNKVAALKAAMKKIQEAKAAFNAMSGWPSWTSAQAESWIDTNIGTVTTLANANTAVQNIKTALKSLADIVIAYRDLLF